MVCGAWSYLACVPVDFVSDAVAAKYGRYDGPPTRVDLEKIFFLDDEDKVLIGRRRGSHMRVGFALQMVTARYLGCFLTDPLDVPNEVLDVVAGCRSLGLVGLQCPVESGPADPQVLGDGGDRLAAGASGQRDGEGVAIDHRRTSSSFMERAMRSGL